MRRNAALLSNPTKRQNKQTIHQQQMQLQSSYDQLQAQMQAQQLGITENTLKYHNKNIYSKLGLKARKEAVQFIRLEKKYHNPET